MSIEDENQSPEKKDLFATLEEIRPVFAQLEKDIKNQEETYWNSLTKEQQLLAFCAVVRRIHQADVVDQGTYRYCLYNVFGFDEGSYVPAQLAGYLDIHNLIYDGLIFQKDLTDAAEEGKLHD